MTREVEKSSLDEMMSAPPNSLKAKQLDEKKAEGAKEAGSHIEAPASIRKQTSAQKIKQALGLGSLKEAAKSVFLNVIIPGAKDVLVEGVKKTVDQTAYGDAAPSRSSGRPSKGGRASTSKVQYNSMSEVPSRRASYRGSRQHYDYEDIWFEDDKYGSPSKSLDAAETVLQDMRDMIEQYDFCKISDLYRFCKQESRSYMDTEWGWDRLKHAETVRVDGGYVLDLPEPIRRS